MNINTENIKDNIVVHLKGHLDAITSPGIHKDLFELIDKGNSRIVLDLAELEYISSAGLQIILHTAKKINSLNGRFALASLQEEVFNVFELSGFTSFLNIFPTLDEALNS